MTKDLLAQWQELDSVLSHAKRAYWYTKPQGATMVEQQATNKGRARWVAARVNLGVFLAAFDDHASNYLTLLDTVVTQTAEQQ